MPDEGRLEVADALLGVFGGLFIVPLFALIQTRCDPKHLSRTIGGMNILNALFMIVAAGVAMLMQVTRSGDAGNLT